MHKACKEILDKLENEGVKINHEFKFPPRRPLTKRLKDVLETEVDEKYYLSDKAIAGYMAHTDRHKERGNGFKFDPTDGEVTAHTISTRAGSRPTDNFIKVVGRLDIKGQDQIKRVYDTSGVSPTLSTMQGGNREPKFDGTTNTTTTVQKDNYVAIRTANKTGYDLATDGDGVDLAYPKSTTRRGRVGHGVSKTLPTSDSQGVLDGYRIRKLTPKECWRLMGFDDTDFEKAAYDKKTITMEDLCYAKLKDVIEKQEQNGTATYALNITNALRELGVTSTEWMILTKKLEKESKPNVNVVIEMLAEQERSDSAINITKCLENGAMLCTLMDEIDQHHTAIIALGKEGKQNTEKYMKITSAESLTQKKLFIILTLTSLIIRLKIFGSTPLKVSIQGCIMSYEHCEKNTGKMLISSLKMEGITTRTSSSQLYKQAGNSIVVKVLEAILKELLNGSTD